MKLEDLDVEFVENCGGIPLAAKMLRNSDVAIWGTISCQITNLDNESV